MHSAITGVRVTPSSNFAVDCRRAVDSLSRQPSVTRFTKRAVISHWQAASPAWDGISAQALALSRAEIPMLSGVLDKGEQHALLLSTLAGLSTSIGGAIAIVKKPGNDLLSFLLGIAIGVMATLSVLEMWLHNAVEHGPIAITAATAVGVALYYVAQPYFPDFEPPQVSPPSTRRNI